MKLKNSKVLSLLTLAVFLLTTALFPLAQAQAAEPSVIEAGGENHYWIGFWLALIQDDHADLHLWYKYVSSEEFTSFTDHLSGSSAITSATSTLIELLDYYPYGDIRIDDGSFSEQRKFTGHEYDDTTGLSYMNARYYNGMIGRFLSQDPQYIRLGFDLSDPQGLNSYAYSRNNPLRYADPNGEAFRDYVNSVRNFASGFTRASAIGPGYVIGGVADMAAHPVDTATAIGGLYADFGRDIVNQPSQTASEISSGIGMVISEFKNQGPYEQGQAVGNIFGQVAAGWAVGRTITSSKQSVNFAPGKSGNPLQNLNSHWQKHMMEFPEFKNPIEYGRGAEQFVTRPPEGTLVRQLQGNRSAYYNSNTNTLGFKENGLPASLYRPDPSIHGQKSNLDYFNSLK